ncbi:MAG: hypothetical protein ACO29C_06565 [Fluviibacter sp.]
MIPLPYRYQYEHVAASQTAQVLGGTGAKGDYIQRLVCTITSATTGNVVLVDGSGTGVLTHTLVPANNGIGVVNLELNAISQDGAWKITTGAGVEVMAIGIFSA